ncbi:MAG: DNA replication/repair protein RecF [Clostridiales bacterium]|nr:DNA replication/repair protein RecF [Clostridiales bacterium]
MRVKWLKLKNFRNYDELAVEFFDGINLISGKNGQGKTNMVEAVMLSALTKSPRTSHDEDMKLEGTDGTVAELCVERNFGDVTIKTTINNETKKTFFINTNEAKKLSEVFGNLVAVYFSPNDLKIVSGGPNERREFMDTDISQLSGSYYNLTQRYEKVLIQRNKLLKMVHDKALLETQIEVWDNQLAYLAGLIIKTRKNFIQKITVPANETMKNISKNADELKISYVGAKGETAKEIEEEVSKSLKNNLSRDMELGYTSIGPHRDDVKFELNGRDSKVFASQGQQRSIVLALKIAEMKVFETEMGEKPIFVLDDVFSELDSSRQKKMFEMLSGTQVLMTGTAFRFKPNESYMQFDVKDAKVKIKFCEK